LASSGLTGAGVWLAAGMGTAPRAANRDAAEHRSSLRERPSDLVLTVLKGSKLDLNLLSF